MAQGPESRLTAKVLKRLREIPVSWWVKIPGGRFLAGIPDIIGCVHGQFVAIEMKSRETGHKLTENQARVLEAIKQAGGVCGVAYSVDEALEIACR